MTRLSLAKKALKLFSGSLTKEQKKAHARKWMAAMATLGDKHILAKPVQRKAN